MTDYTEQVRLLRNRYLLNGEISLWEAARSIEALVQEIDRLCGHIEDTAADTRRDALEEAAKVCDDEARHWYGCDLPARMCASGIRALIEKGE